MLSALSSRTNTLASPRGFGALATAEALSRFARYVSYLATLRANAVLFSDQGQPRQTGPTASPISPRIPPLLTDIRLRYGKLGQIINELVYDDGVYGNFGGTPSQTKP